MNDVSNLAVLVERSKKRDQVNNQPFELKHELVAVVNPKEEDPSGLDQHSPGAKLDQGKPMVSLVLGGFARALMEVAKVGTFGAKKYTPNGWMSVANGIDRYSDAKARHQLYEAMGEEHDPDSGLLHAAHEAWNALAVLELKLREQAAKQAMENDNALG